VLSVVKIDFKPEGVTMDEKVGKYRKKEDNLGYGK
jgi:uncharacterized protein YqgV (UPF0045/DUF77 family)